MINSGSHHIDRTVTSLIDGSSRASDNDIAVDVMNPSNGQLCLRVPVGSAEDVDCAVASCRRAFDAGHWSETPSLRKMVLHALADQISAHGRELDELDAEEMGKPVSLGFGNAVATASLMRFYAEAVDKESGDVYASDKWSFVTQRRVPRGVVAAVVPWNFPTYVTVTKLAPALAAGNCVVLKPSEMSSRSGIRLAQLALQAGIPPGVLNVVPGLGETVGRALGLHMGVDMLTFTGSTEVGKLMLQYAGQSNLKVVIAECGGKSPHIVFDDGVDLDMAARVIARHLLTNQGQLCSVGSRLLVQRVIETEMLEKVSVILKDVVMGDARDPNTTFGPLASAKQCARVMHYIETAHCEGAELVTGGRRALLKTGGYFVEPTLFRNVSATARVAKEEVFGPVLSVMPFDDEAEAIRLANDTVYGLAAYVWTTNISTGMLMAKRIKSSVRIHAVAPIGDGAGHASSSEPYGLSGFGAEGGMAGMESYLRRQRVWLNHG